MRRKREGPEKEAGGNKTRERVTLRVEKEESCGPLEFDARHAASLAQRRTKIEPGTWGALQEKGTARRREVLIPNHESQRLSTEAFVLPSQCLEVEYGLPVQGRPSGFHRTFAPFHNLGLLGNFFLKVLPCFSPCAL